MAGRFFNRQGKGSERGPSALRLFLVALISGTLFVGVVFAADYTAGTYSSGTYGGGVYGTGDATAPAAPAPSGGGGGAQIFGSGPTAPGYVNTNPTGTSTVPAVTATTTAATSSPATLITPTVTTPPPSSAIHSTVSFSHNYQLWDEGADILLLQQYLNSHGYILTTTGNGSPGNETDIFGPHTYRALIKFQSSNDLPPTGYFGPLTRALINSQIQ